MNSTDAPINQRDHLFFPFKLNWKNSLLQLKIETHETMTVLHDSDSDLAHKFDSKIQKLESLTKLTTHTHCWWDTQQMACHTMKIFCFTSSSHTSGTHTTNSLLVHTDIHLEHSYEHMGWTHHIYWTPYVFVSTDFPLDTLCLSTRSTSYDIYMDIGGDECFSCNNATRTKGFFSSNIYIQPCALTSNWNRNTTTELLYYNVAYP